MKEKQEQKQILWRRAKVMELTSQGHSQRDISKILQLSLGTVNKDLSYLRGQSWQKIRKYVDQTLPEEYEKCLVGITSILKEAWNTSQSTENKKEKIQALSLAKECYSMKLDLLTNATVVNDAMKFVSSNNNKKSVSGEEDSSSSQESKEQESDYDEDKDSDKQGEEKQEEETGELTKEKQGAKQQATTINKVF